jgi:hypothetical protein
MNACAALFEFVFPSRASLAICRSCGELSLAGSGQRLDVLASSVQFATSTLGERLGAHLAGQVVAIRSSTRASERLSLRRSRSP